MLAFFGTALSLVTGFGSSILNLLKKYPWQLAGILVLMAVAYGASVWSEKRTTTRLNAAHAKVLKEFEDQRQGLQRKISEVEASSKKAADAAESDIFVLKANLDRVKEVYEKRLEAARTSGSIASSLTKGQVKTQYVYIKVPGANTDTSELLLQNGVVACRRLPEQFTSTINEMIEEVNKSIQQ